MTAPTVETIDREQVCNLVAAAFNLGQRWMLKEAARIQEAEQQAELLGIEAEVDHDAIDRELVDWIRRIASNDESPIEAASDLRRAALAEGMSEADIAALEAGRHRMQKSIRLAAPYLLESLEVGTGDCPAANGPAGG
jgi:tRNA(Ile)-lysidine synthase TilS/MesJ